MKDREAITLSLNPDEKAELEALAQQFGIFWGSQPNISGLVRAIARKRIMLYQPGTPITGGDRDYYRASPCKSYPHSKSRGTAPTSSLPTAQRLPKGNCG